MFGLRLALLLALATSPPATANPAIAPAAWIARHCVGASGAITVRPGGNVVSGYFGNLTALGLADTRRDPSIVRGWLAWYVHQAARSADGVPPDATLRRNGRVAFRHRPDSTDAYGATFLMLARAAYGSSDPATRAFIAGHRAAIRRIAASIVATQQPSGLTWSRPGHPIAYAIDNEQVYRGLLDGAALFRQAYHDDAVARELDRQAERVIAGLRHVLWDAQTHTFRPFVGVRAAGAYPAANLAVAYPDALAQVMAIIYGVVPARSPLAAALLHRSSPALAAERPGIDAVDFRFILLDARRRMGEAAVRALPFTAPSLCVDAGWLLQGIAQP